MIRSDFDISDDDFARINEPFAKEVTEYLKNNFILDYIAFYISKGFQYDALFEGSLNGVFGSAIDSLCDIHFGTQEDIKRLKTILKDKYNLLLTSDTDLEIEDIQK